MTCCYIIQLETRLVNCFHFTVIYIKLYYFICHLQPVFGAVLNVASMTKWEWYLKFMILSMSCWKMENFRHLNLLIVAWQLRKYNKFWNFLKRDKIEVPAVIKYFFYEIFNTHGHAKRVKSHFKGYSPFVFDGKKVGCLNVVEIHSWWWEFWSPENRYDRPNRLTNSHFRTEWSPIDATRNCWH